MSALGYFLYPFGKDGELAAIPATIQVDGSVSYDEGWGVDYTVVNTNPNYKSIPWGQFNQLFFDITSAIQLQQQGSPPPFITSAMNGGSAYVYPAGAIVSSGGISYISLVPSNGDTPPSSKWAISFGAQTGAFTAGHIAVFADNKGTIQDGGLVPSGYVLPAATSSSLGGVIPDGTIISVDGSGHITVPKASNSVFGVVEVDNSTIASASGVIAIKNNAPLPGSPTTTTQSPGDNSIKVATTAYVNNAVGVPTFTKSYNSGDQTISTAGTLTLAHGMGIAPKGVMTSLHCLTGEHGFTAGQVLVISTGASISATGLGAANAAITTDATNINVKFANASSVFGDGMIDNSTGNVVTPGFTNGNWAFVVEAWA